MSEPIPVGLVTSAFRDPASPLRKAMAQVSAPVDRTRLAPGRRWAFLGDSIMNGSTAGNFAYSLSSIAQQVCGSLAVRPDYVEAGTSGYTSAAALPFLPTVLAGGYGIEGLVVLLGTNDGGGNVPLSTYAANMTQIVALAKAQGMPVVLCTVPPRTTPAVTTQTRTLTAQYNAWIRLWGPMHGCEVAEVHAALVDPTTGDLLTAYNSDGTHPNGLGHSVMGQVVGQAMLRAMSIRPQAFSYSKNAFSLVSNPLMSGGGVSSRPTSWFEQPGGTGTAPTYSTFADTTGLLPAGQWAQMDFDATAAGGSREFATAPAFTGVTVGDVVAFTGLLLVEDLTGTWRDDVAAGTAVASIDLRNQSNVTIKSGVNRCPGRDLGNAFGTGNKVWQLGPFLTPAVVPAGTTGFGIYCGVKLQTSTHVKVRFGMIDLFDLTTLGLADLAGNNGVSTPVNLDGPTG